MTMNRALCLLVLVLCGCDDHNSQPIDNYRLSYRKTCIEGVTYIVSGHDSPTAQFDKDSKVIPCQ